MDFNSNSEQFSLISDRNHFEFSMENINKTQNADPVVRQQANARERCRTHR